VNNQLTEDIIKSIPDNYSINDYNSIKKSNIILNTCLEITKDIISDKKEIDIKKILEIIGTKLDVEKVFLLRFPVLDTNYIEWMKSEFEIFQIKKNHDIKNEQEEYDISKLMEWVYYGEAYYIDIKSYPDMFRSIIRTTQVINYYKILVPVTINNKPWGIMGIGQIIETQLSDIVKESFVNLCKLVSLIIRQKEERELVNKIIDKKLIEFKQKAKIYN
jgi:transcriptional regulator with GAF, ATPase, and Fis domain